MTKPGETSKPPVRPLTEGYVVKGGHNPGTSQIQTRPAAPAPMTPAPTPSAPTPPASPAPSAPPAITPSAPITRRHNG
jgi:hypothetical protein